MARAIFRTWRSAFRGPSMTKKWSSRWNNPTSKKTFYSIARISKRKRVHLQTVQMSLRMETAHREDLGAIYRYRSDTVNRPVWTSDVTLVGVTDRSNGTNARISRSVRVCIREKWSRADVLKAHFGASCGGNKPSVASCHIVIDRERAWRSFIDVSLVHGASSSARFNASLTRDIREHDAPNVSSVWRIRDMQMAYIVCIQANDNECKLSR